MALADGAAALLLHYELLLIPCLAYMQRIAYRCGAKLAQSNLLASYPDI